MKVSVLVPVFKVEKWIERCVRSLFTQTYHDLEYIFVNDCTPDRSVDIILSVAEEYPRTKESVTIINNKQNFGLAYCRDAAIARACGEFVCIVDSDDWLEPDAIEQLVEEQQKANSDVVWGNAMMHTPSGDMILREPHYADKHEWLLCYCRLTTGYIMVNWRRIIRRSLFSEHNIKAIKGTHYGEDKLLMTQVAYFSKSFSTIDRVVYHYNQLRTTSITAVKHRKEFNAGVFNQEIQSIHAIEDFWQGKETIYYEELMKAKLRFLLLRLSDALRYSSWRGYNMVKRHIDSVDHRYYEEVGLDNWKSRLIYSYYCIAKFYFLYR